MRRTIASVAFAGLFAALTVSQPTLAHAKGMKLGRGGHGKKQVTYNGSTFTTRPIATARPRAMRPAPQYRPVRLRPSGPAYGGGMRVYPPMMGS